MTLEEIEKLEMELAESRVETIKKIIAYYQNDLSAVMIKKDCVKIAKEIFENSFRMLNELRENIKGDDIYRQDRRINV